MNLQSLLGLIPTCLSLGGHLMVCDSSALKYSFLIQLFNLVFYCRNSDLFQHQKINWKTSCGNPESSCGHFQRGASQAGSALIPR